MHCVYIKQKSCLNDKKNDKRPAVWPDLVVSGMFGRFWDLLVGENLVWSAPTKHSNLVVFGLLVKITAFFMFFIKIIYHFQKFLGDTPLWQLLKIPPPPQNFQNFQNYHKNCNKKHSLKNLWSSSPPQSLPSWRQRCYICKASYDSPSFSQKYNFFRFLR